MTFLKHTCRAGLLLVGLSTPPCVAQGRPAPLEVPGLQKYVAGVLRQNALLRAAKARTGGAARRIAPAGALPDPTLTIGAMSVPVTSFDLEREPMTQFPIMLQQRVPFPGKRAAATAVSRADSTVAERSRESLEARLVAAAVHAYFELAGARTAVAIWRRRLALADQAITVARVRYETGAAPQTDLLRARLRRSELDEEGQSLLATVQGAGARTDMLRAGDTASIATPLLASPAALPGLREDSVPGDAEARDTMVANNAELRASGADITRAQRAVAVLDLAARPDLTIGVQTGIRLGGREPFVTALFGVSLPLYAARKQHPAAEAGRHDLLAARAEYEDARARLTGDLLGVLATVRALKSRILQTADEIVPLAEAASTSAVRRYQVGAIDFGAVLDSQDDLFRAQLRLARLTADYGAAWGLLAALTGEEWYP